MFFFLLISTPNVLEETFLKHQADASKIRKNINEILLNAFISINQFIFMIYLIVLSLKKLLCILFLVNFIIMY